MTMTTLTPGVCNSRMMDDAPCPDNEVFWADSVQYIGPLVRDSDGYYGFWIVTRCAGPGGTGPSGMYCTRCYSRGENWNEKSTKAFREALISVMRGLQQPEAAPGDSAPSADATIRQMAQALAKERELHAETLTQFMTATDKLKDKHKELDRERELRADLWRVVAVNMKRADLQPPSFGFGVVGTEELATCLKDLVEGVDRMATDALLRRIGRVMNGVGLHYFHTDDLAAREQSIMEVLETALRNRARSATRGDVAHAIQGIKDALVAAAGRDSKERTGGTERRLLVNSILQAVAQA